MSQPKLFHVSKESDIHIFDPRPAPSPGAGVTGDAVWAVDEVHRCNYLLPRDCPHFAFAASEKTSQKDRDYFFPKKSASRIVAVKNEWLSRIEKCQLYLYKFSADDFKLVDAGAGYYISRKSVHPISITKISRLLLEIANRGVEVQFLSYLWELRNSVTASSLEFSIIRFRNVSPPPGPA